MRLATFNLLHGQSLSDSRVDPDRLRAAVRELDPDVLGLQEVDRSQPRSGHLDLAAVAADAMGARACRFVPAIDGTPGGRWSPARDEPDPSRPAYGIALLSRLPVVSWQVTRLPALPMRSPVLTGTRRVILARDEPRVAVAGVLQTAAGPMTVATTHLSFVPGWNAVQLRRLLAALRPLPRPTVLMGDLNIPGALPRALAAWRPLVCDKTFPAGEPKVQLDHVLALGDVPPVVDAEVTLLPLSDHRAVTVELAEPGPGL